MRVAAPPGNGCIGRRTAPTRPLYHASINMPVHGRLTPRAAGTSNRPAGIFPRSDRPARRRGGTRKRGRRGEVGFFCCDEHLQQRMVAQSAAHAGYKLTLAEVLEVGLAIFGPVFAVAA